MKRKPVPVSGASFQGNPGDAEIPEDRRQQTGCEMQRVRCSVRPDLHRGPLLGLPQAENQRMARVRSADVRSGITGLVPSSENT